MRALASRSQAGGGEWLGDTPFWHLRAPKGAELASLRGGVPVAPLSAGFRRLV